MLGEHGAHKENYVVTSLKEDRPAAVLSGFSDDLASPTRALFKTTLHFHRTTVDLDCGERFDLRDHLSSGAIPVAPRWDQRMATLLDPRPGLRHRDRQRDIFVSTTSRHICYSRVPCRSRCRVSSQRCTLSACL